MFKLTSNVKPKWYQIRRQLSRFLVFLARKVNKECPYAYTHYLEEITKVHMDAMTYGEGALEVNHKPVTMKINPISMDFKERMK